MSSRRPTWLSKVAKLVGDGPVWGLAEAPNNDPV
jgi:hypothetical protein